MSEKSNAPTNGHRTGESGLEPISPSEAIELYIDHRKPDLSEKSVQNHRYRVHPSNAGISRVEDSCLQFFYRWVSAYSRWVNPHSGGRVRLFAKRGSVPSGGLGEGVLSIVDKEAQSRYTQQPARKPSATGGSARSVEVGGSGGFSGGRALAADAGGRGRSSSGGRGAESVPSAGWREVAEAYHATEGQSHE